MMEKILKNFRRIRIKLLKAINKLFKAIYRNILKIINFLEENLSFFILIIWILRYLSNIYFIFLNSLLQ